MVPSALGSCQPAPPSDAFVLLLAGAEALVRGASRLAVALGVSPLIVGLTIVSLGTSAPEISVSIDSILRGQGDLAVGNVVGSNTFRYQTRPYDQQRTPSVWEDL